MFALMQQLQLPFPKPLIVDDFDPGTGRFTHLLGQIQNGTLDLIAATMGVTGDRIEAMSTVPFEYVRSSVNDGSTRKSRKA